MCPDTITDETRLGILAMRFRGTRDQAERRVIAEEYSRVVDRLIRGGQWEQLPAAEDQLPDEWMPEAFFRYWFPSDSVEQNRTI